MASEKTGRMIDLPHRLIVDVPIYVTGHVAFTRRFNFENEAVLASTIVLFRRRAKKAEQRWISAVKESELGSLTWKSTLADHRDWIAALHAKQVKQLRQ